MRRLASTLFLLAAAARATDSAEGLVVDRAGRPVAGAVVTLVRSGSTGSVTTDASGRFSFPAEGLGAGALTVEADGYARETVTLGTEGFGSRALRIVLSRPSHAEALTVTATRMPTRLSETAASVVELSSEELAATAALPLDAALRQVPGFTLFRRSDSRVANPTTQGVSLRGVGGSGASRAVVLDDGVALNDPFGGWVHWGRIVRASVERVEVLRGGSSDLYGGSALTGAIQLIRRDPADSALSFESSYGSEHTADGAVFLAGRAGSWGARVAVESFRTDGYDLVPADLRGPTDEPASSRHTSADVTLEREKSAEPHLFIRGTVFDESRGNGTRLQVNDTRLWQVTAGADGAFEPGAYSVRAYGFQESYHQTFSAVSPDRATETLTRRQAVPSWAAGSTGEWTASLGAHRVVAGGEARAVTGESDEVVFAGSGPSVSDAGGRQVTGALFVEDLFQPAARLSIAAGARVDGWRNFDAFRRTGPATQPSTPQSLASRTETAWSPRVAFLFQATPAVALTASGFRSFRAPTLNELYRSFRLGNTVTLANESLRAERLTGGEIGALISLFAGRLGGRGTLFWEEIEGTISNLTLSSNQTLVTRQRRNLGRTRSRGAEMNLEARVSDALAVSAGYLYADSTVQRFEANPLLEGLRLPQVPRHQASVQVRYELRGVARAAVQGRYVGSQFEDDANAFSLGGFATIDALIGANLTRAAEVFVAGENLTGKRYVVARTPLPNLGPPRTVRGGVRVRVGD